MVEKGSRTENVKKSQKNDGQNILRFSRSRFSAKVDFAHLISYESQKCEDDQNQPRHAVKSGFARQLRAVDMQLTRSEGHLWPKMAKKVAKYILHNRYHFPTTYLYVLYLFELIFISLCLN